MGIGQGRQGDRQERHFLDRLLSALRLMAAIIEGKRMRERAQLAIWVVPLSREEEDLDKLANWTSLTVGASGKAGGGVVPCREMAEKISTVIRRDFLTSRG